MFVQFSNQFAYSTTNLKKQANTGKPKNSFNKGQYLILDHSLLNATLSHVSLFSFPFFAVQPLPLCLVVFLNTKAVGFLGNECT